MTGTMMGDTAIGLHVVPVRPWARRRSTCLSVRCGTISVDAHPLLLRLHHGQPFGDAVHWRDKRSREASRGAQGASNLRLLCSLQRHPVGLLRGHKRCLVRARAGEGTKGLAAIKEGRIDPEREPTLG